MRLRSLEKVVCYKPRVILSDSRIDDVNSAQKNNAIINYHIECIGDVH